MDSMFTTTPASPQNRQLEDDKKPEKNEVHRNNSVKWASPPPECLSLIFEAALESVFPVDDDATDDSDLCEYLLTITQICRWWRQVALDTPRLWRILILNDKTPLSKLQTWLDRSKAAPLCINLEADHEASLHIELIPLLLQHINHWSRFMFDTAVPWGLTDLLGALEGKEAPLLEKLALSQGQIQVGHVDIRQSSPTPARKLFNGPQSVPKLIEIDFWRIPLDLSNGSFRNLRKLTLSWIHNADKPKLEHFMTVLRESPQLMLLALVQSAVRPDELTAAFNRNDQTPQPISLPSLVNLRISDYYAPDTLTLTLRLIHAPNLKTLWLTSLSLDEDGLVAVDFSSTIEALGNGVLSSFEHLESLGLHRVCCFSKAAWNHFCTKLTHLRDMSLGHTYSGPIDPEDGGDEFDCLLSALLPRRNESGLTPTSGRTEDTRKVECRNLQSLHVSGCSERTVVNFARRRLEAGYGLAQVIFRANGGLSEGIFKEFSEMGVQFACFPDSDESEGGSDSEEDEDSEADES